MCNSDSDWSKASYKFVWNPFRYRTCCSKKMSLCWEKEGILLFSFFFLLHFSFFIEITPIKCYSKRLPIVPNHGRDYSDKVVTQRSQLDRVLFKTLSVGVWEHYQINVTSESCSQARQPANSSIKNRETEGN